jgi:hypothetical protein
MIHTHTLDGAGAGSAVRPTDGWDWESSHGALPRDRPSRVIDGKRRPPDAVTRKLIESASPFPI